MTEKKLHPLIQFVFLGMSPEMLRVLEPKIEKVLGPIRGPKANLTLLWFIGPGILAGIAIGLFNSWLYAGALIYTAVLVIVARILYGLTKLLK